MQQYWNVSTWKFNLQHFQSSACPAMRVGICLAGFGDLTNFYKSPRLLFTRAPVDTLSLSQFSSEIDDLVSIADRHINATSALPGHKAAQKLLIFFAVGAKPEAYDLLKSNVAVLRNGGWSPHLFLAFYKGKKSMPLAEGLPVENHLTAGGQKIQLLESSYERFHKKWRSNYEYVWVVDEDFNMTGFQIEKFMDLARQSGAAIVGPTYTDLSPHRSKRATTLLQNPHAQCKYRYVDFVEVGAPLLHIRTWNPIFRECDGCVHQNSMWGLDVIWCYYVASRLGYPLNSSAIKAERRSACALIDATSIVHENYKTLAKVTDENLWDLWEVKKNYPQFAIDQRNPFEYCVK